VRKLVGEARRNNLIGSEEAAGLTDLPNIRQKGTRLGNWLTREQAKELLAVPDRSTLKGKRDYVILRFWSAALSGGTSWPNSTSRPSTKRGALGPGGPRRQGPAHPHRRHPHLGQAGHRRLDGRGRHR
jgi:hypothetical protein